jgi:hypothetical protein
VDPVDLGLERREASVEVLAGGEVAQQAAVGERESLAGHDHRDPGRVGHDHRRADPAGELLDADKVDRCVDELLVGGGRGDDGVG